MISDIEQTAIESHRDSTCMTPENISGYYQNTGINEYSVALGIDIEESIEKELNSKEDFSYDNPFRILDIGCGGCNFLHSIEESDISPYIEVFGIDREYCKHDIPDDHYIVGNVENLENISEFGKKQFEIPDDSFNMIFSRKCLQWTDDQVSALKEASRVLKENGKGYLTCLITDKDLEELDRSEVSYKPLSREFDYVGTIEIKGKSLSSSP